MEEKIFKLISLFAVIGIVVWLIAAAMGKRDEVENKKKCDWRTKKPGDKWQTGIAPGMAQPLNFGAPSVSFVSLWGA